MEEQNAADNQAAPEADAAELSSIEAGLASKTGDAKVAEGTVTNTQKDVSPSKTVETVQPSFDAQKRYEELEKNFQETRKWATQVAQERAEYRKQFEALTAQQKAVADMIAKATEVPVDPAALMKDPKAMLEYIKAQTEAARSAVKGEYEPQLKAMNDNLRGLKLSSEVNMRKADAKNYPNFADLEPTMMEIVNSGKCPVDVNGDPAVVLDALYKLAKESNGEQAIKIAEKAAYQKAESQLAKEAKSAVAKGGKGASSTPGDLRTMNMDKLEQMIIQNHGVADRD